jgi:hypothetical protein
MGVALAPRILLGRKEVTAVDGAALSQKGVVPGKDYQWIEVIAVLKAITDLHWFMVIKMDTEEIFAAWCSRSTLILALIGLLMTTVAAAVDCGLIGE